MIDPLDRTLHAGSRSRRPALLLAVLVAAQFMVILDITVMNVALPEIGSALGMGRESLTWVIAAYTLPFGGFLILGGRLADARGRKPAFLVGITLFTAASLLGGLAGNGALLLGARAAQGFGAALLSPAALAVVNTEFTGGLRARALTIWAAVGGAGAAVGVVIGGALASGPGWQWAFLINVPIGVIVIVGVLRLLPDRPPSGDRRLAARSGLLGTSAVALTIYATTRAGSEGWTSNRTLGLLVLAAAAAVAFVISERRGPLPLLPKRLIGRRPVWSGTIAMFGATGLLLPTYFLTSIYLQHFQALTALETGLAFLPAAVTTIIGAHLGGHIVGHAGPKVVGTLGFAFSTAGFGMLARHATDNDNLLTDILIWFMLASLGVGAVFVVATYSAFSGVQPEDSGLVSGVLNTGHELGASVSVALVSTIAAASLSPAMPADDTGIAFGYIAIAVMAGTLTIVAVSLLRTRTPAPQGPALLH